MKITNELLERYASGLCTQDEVVAVEAWLASGDSEASFPAGFDTERHKAANWEAINERNPTRLAETVPIWSYARLGRWLVAALFIAACGLVFWMYTGNAPVRVETPVAFKVISTKPGEKRQVKLSDGSVVYLNSGSEMRVPAAFKDSVRMVYLNGEAFLQVSRDAAHPFIVRTMHADIRVLGTQFNVHAFPGEDSTVVAVKEGRVRLSSRQNASAGIILTHHEKGIYLPGSAPRVDNVYIRRYLEWKDNNLVIDNQRMDEIARLLQRWYGVEVKLGSDQIAGQRFTGEFANQPVEYVVEKLCYVMDFKYKLAGKKILIY